MIFIWL